MTHEEAIQRAIKLLRLAQSDNPNEAASAAAKAQEIIDRYKLESLSLSDQSTEAPKPEEPVKDFVGAPMDEGEKLSSWRIRLASTIAYANQCRIYISNRNKDIGSRWVSTKSIAIVGRPSDAETIRYLYAWLVQEVDRLAERDGQGMGKSWRNNFRLGVVETISARLVEQRKSTQNEIRAEEFAKGGESAIVRVNTAIVKLEARSAEVDIWIKKNLKLRYGGSSRSTFNPSARQAGRTAGQEINLSGTRGSLGAGRKALK